MFIFSGDEEERKSFRSKGIPVIFQDELDEKPEIGNKSPVILKDEKPPLLPPLYTSTNPDGKFFFFFLDFDYFLGFFSVLIWLKSKLGST